MKERVGVVDFKSIFISHSSLDFEFANRICKSLEENNLPCWIAPRDIPYGNIWPPEISSAIEQAKLMIFVFSEHSNKSPQVLNEINLALQNGIKIIPVHITSKPYNPSLRYLLSLHQSVFIRDTESEDEIKQLVFGIQRYLSGESDPYLVSDAFSDTPVEVQCNLDDELDAKFTELFSNLTEPEMDNPANDLRNKLIQRIGSRFVESMALPKEEDEQKNTEDPEPATDTASTGKYFSLAEHDAPTAVFIVRQQFLPPEYIKDYTVEKLDQAIEYLDDGSKKVTYFAESPDAYGNALVFVSFMKGKELTLVNMGFLDRDAMIMSRNPIAIKYNNYIAPSDKKILRFPVREQEINIIMDPETCDVVPRKKYYDSIQKKWLFYVELVAKKQYFAFQIKAHEKSKADPFAIGYGYYKGAYGLTKNVIEAAVWFEKASTSEAYRYLSEIFSRDPLLQDEEDAAYYAKKAAEMES